jgi:tight adherence protein C
LGVEEIRAMMQLAAAFFFTIFVMGVAYFIYNLVNNPSKGMENRLKNLRSGSGPTGNEQTSDRFQKMLEDAAPQLAEKLMPQNESQQSELKLKLAHAGYRGEHVVAKFLVIQFGCLVAALVIGAPYFYVKYGFTTDFYLYTLGFAGLFYYLPNIIVRFRTSSRQEQIFLGLPDALDLLVVCVEAGLGLDQGMRKVCEEMGRSRPIISEEFSICNFQLQMGRPRREVLHDLGQRTGVDDMKSLAAVLIQADRFGASIGNALRVQSDAMRVRRRQLAEERAAKTAVQLIFPLVLFIFPAIFVVLVGPAAIKIMETMGSM